MVANTNQNSRIAIESASQSEITTFLRWNLDNYSARKRSSIRQLFKHWRQLYRRTTGKDWALEDQQDVNTYISGTLTNEYKLDTRISKKDVMNIDDVFLVLHHHWAWDTSNYPDPRQMLQLAFIMLICAYTASRPGALVYVKKNSKVMDKSTLTNITEGRTLGGGGNEDIDEDDEDGEEDSENDICDIGGSRVEGTSGLEETIETEGTSAPNEAVETLCYKHVTLTLIPNPGGERDLLAMEIDPEFTKGARRNYKRKTYCLYEVDDLIFDPVICMLTLGILDEAFEVDFASVDEIFQLRVLPPRRSMRLRWKKTWEERPIFRQAVKTSDGHQTSDTQPWQYHSFLYCLQRLGFKAGMMQILKPYNIRRGAGEAVDGIATQAQLQQVMGHRDAGIFQAYINERVQCDVQAAFLGRPSADALFKATAHMSRDIDPRAPTRLTDSEFVLLNTDPLVRDLCEARDNLTKEARRMHGSLKKAAAAGSPLYAMWDEIVHKLDNTKKSLHKEKLKEVRAKFFEQIETADARKQLDGLTLNNDDAVSQPAPKLTAERERAAELLLKSSRDLAPQDKLPHRIQTIQALVELCKTPGFAFAHKRMQSSTRYRFTAAPSPLPIVKLEPIRPTDKQLDPVDVSMTIATFPRYVL
ncbi:MAG: hypothetical protein M1822_004590 [Bathelium mastoideum]|nr:MAG: hypothetical protein M1822_004590 [Bathelium mastoideum]